MNGNYIVNFFVEPNIKAIAWNDGCWPITTPDARKFGFIFLMNNPEWRPIDFFNRVQGMDMAYTLLPLNFDGVSQNLKFFYNLLTAGTSADYKLPYFCERNDALKVFYDLLNAYGIIGLISFFIPLINILITLAAVLGISELMGGDVSLAGLSYLV